MKDKQRFGLNKNKIKHILNDVKPMKSTKGKENIHETKHINIFHFIKKYMSLYIALIEHIDDDVSFHFPAGSETHITLQRLTFIECDQRFLT